MSDIRHYEPLWGAWHVEGLIGEGSFGKVYKIKREEFGKTYFSAVKLITIPQGSADLRQMRSEGMDEASARSYFHAFVADIVQEIHMLSEFRGNSHIVSFEDHKVIEKTGEFGWDILIRMELLKSLTDYAMERTLSPAEVVKLGIHICRALELCARRQIIHRDIKPDNIFISQYGDYKLGDFGIARQVERTMSGLSKKGTYTYMAPEVFRGDEYGPTVDIYSLGIVMYRFLNGNRTPFLPDFPAPMTLVDREAAQQRRMQGEVLPPPKDGSAALKAAVLKACAYNSKDRFASAAEMRVVLEAFAGERHGDAPAAVEAAVVVPEVTGSTVGLYADAHGGGVGFLEEQTGATVGVFDDGLAQEVALPVPTPQKRRFIPALLVALLVVTIILLFWLGSKPPSTITIKGQQYSTSLTQLDLTGLELTNVDIEPLRYMTKLKLLWLTNNQISDITALKGLTNLTKLGLDINQISDISALKGLDNLAMLDLSFNHISDISALSGLASLSLISLENNPVSDISALSRLTSLTELWLEACQISDISALSGLTNLRLIRLENNRISDINALSRLTNLTELRLDYNQISDISALRGLPNLTWLMLTGNPIGDWSPVDHVENVEGRSVTIKGQQYNTNLTALDLSGQGLTDADIEPLKYMVNLETLNLSSNLISDLSVLRGLTKLTELIMDYNKISDISVLKELTNLTVLHMKYNQISDISVLRELINLNSVSLYFNPITDWRPVDHVQIVFR